VTDVPAEDLAPAVREEVLFLTRPAPFLLVPAVPYAVLAVAIAITLPIGDLTNLVALAALVVLAGGQLAMRVFELRRLRSPWTLRIAADGISCRFPPQEMTWSQVAEIRVRERWPLGSWLLPSGIKLVSRAELEFSRRAGTRAVGVVLDVRYLDGGVDDIVAAIRRFTDLPVIRTW
jgi:hypothetical protein